MYRTSIIKAASPLASRRLLSSTARVLTGGDTGSGASRIGGDRAGDAFTKREAAAEAKYIREQEIAKLQAIRAKLDEQSKHIDDLKQHIDDVTKERAGGEQN